MKKAMGLVIEGDGWRLSDRVWWEMEKLLPKEEAKPHPLGCHRRRKPDREAMEAILYVLRTGCQWNALKQTKLCPSSTAHRRFLLWVGAGVFERFWQAGLLQYDQAKGIGWSWLSMDGTMTKAPLAGTKKRARTRRTGASRGSSAAC